MSEWMDMWMREWMITMITSKSICPRPLIQLQVFSNYVYLAVSQGLQIHYMSNSNSASTTSSLRTASLEPWNSDIISDCLNCSLFFLTFYMYKIPSENVIPLWCFPWALTPRLPFLPGLSETLSRVWGLRLFVNQEEETEPNTKAAECSLSWEKENSYIYLISLCCFSSCNKTELYLGEAEMAKSSGP